jgi:hypothetical protein
MGVHHRFLALSARGARQWTPREERYPVKAPTTVTTAAGISGAAVVSNVSNNGCRIATLIALQPGNRLKLVVEPLGLVEAEVQWTSDGEAGLELTGRDAFHSDYEFSFSPDR